MLSAASKSFLTSSFIKYATYGESCQVATIQSTSTSKYSYKGVGWKTALLIITAIALTIISAIYYNSLPKASNLRLIPVVTMSISSWAIFRGAIKAGLDAYIFHKRKLPEDTGTGGLSSSAPGAAVEPPSTAGETMEWMLREEGEGGGNKLTLKFTESDGPIEIEGKD